MNIKIIVNSSKITPASNGAVKEYGKRLSRYCKFHFFCCKKEKDAFKHLTPSTTAFSILPSKETLSSEQLSKKIETLGLTGKSDLLFLIGFSEEFLASAMEGIQIETISISSLNLSPSLTTAILSEQIYRAYRIMKKEPYHK
ncbi:MAG: 23S rRNA (pseudouridine(1915)-N(3))-methyltransferase RlmH [Clostridiales bacterium]|nr:23S rRNA (pseudouridine(1915)-N(3))-methyltransferase RlmH [Clostridiales bacterium]